jgi:molecular chaperone GrpE
MVKKKRHDEEEEKNVSNVELSENKENPETNELPAEGSSSDVAGQPEQVVENVTDKTKAEAKNFEEKLAEMQDKYLRLSAEFDNYRKRTLREKMDLTKYAGESILSKIIPFMDDFERARRHMEDSADCESIKSGLDLIYEKFAGFLQSNGVKEIKSLNMPFNVDLHEAVAKVPVQDEEKKGKIVDVVSKGYYLQDKVLRFAKVIVGE